MDAFEFFFAFYGLLLGLAAVEILSSFGAFVRVKAVRRLGVPSAALAFLVFLVICATWLDAWSARADFNLSFEALWAPVGAATAYYLAATVVLPKDEQTFHEMAAYFRDRKTFVISMMLIGELFVKVTFLPAYIRSFQETPHVFWTISVPLNVTVIALWCAMLFLRRPRHVVAAMVAQVAVFSGFYWIG